MTTTARRGSGGAQLEQLRLELAESKAREAELLIENGRLRMELDAALEQQAATAEALRIVARSAVAPQLQAVLQEIVETAARVCAAPDAIVSLLEEGRLRHWAGCGPVVSTATFPFDRTHSLDPQYVNHRAVLEGRTIHVHDVLAEDPAAYGKQQENSRRVHGGRTILAVLLRRGDGVLGVFQAYRREVRPFTEREVSLLELFADQAVIAIENARLFQELNDANVTLKEALEQQTATAEVLAAISRAPTDLQGVLDKIADSATRLCGADQAAVIALRDGDQSRFVAGATVTGRRFTLDSRAVPLDRNHSLAHRAIVDAAVVHVVDVMDPAFEEDGALANAARVYRNDGAHTMLAVPLLSQGEAVGAIHLARAIVRPFTDQQIALVRTFADQAVIAIENARLFSELQERLEEQTATAEVLQVISESPTALQRVLDTIAERAARLCGTERALIALVEGGVARPVAGMSTDGERRTLEQPGAPIALERHHSPLSRAIVDRAVVHVPDLETVSVEELRAVRGRQFGLRTVLSVPLLRGETAIGAIALQRREVRPFTERQVALMQTFADQAVIAIENTRLFAELQDRTKTLQEALEQQTATSDVLRVIAGSPNDLQQVLDTIAESAARLASGTGGSVWRVQGDALQRAGFWADAPDTGARGRIAALTREHTAGRAVLDIATVHVPSMEAALAAPAVDGLSPTFLSNQIQEGLRSSLATPLMRDGIAIGALSVRRTVAAPFTDQQIRLLESFADQAVIAIENARLFSELQDSNATLTEALEQQTATADVLQVIGSSQGNLDAVFRAMVESAARLCHADVIVFMQDERDPTRFVRMGETGVFSGTLPARNAGGVPIDPEYVSGAAFRERRTIVVDDPAGPEGEPYPKTRAASRRMGTWTATVFAPLLRDGEPIGVIGAVKATPGSITPQQVTLLETFADQAVVAIENERLLRELRERDDRRARELERASAIQQRLLPAEVQGWPGVLEIAVRFRPAVETSGDFYDMVRLAPAEEGALPPLQIAVGDVAGKGMSAALVTALARTALRTTTSVPVELATPASTLRLAGRRLHADVGSGHFVACALAVVEPPGLHHRGPLLRLANAAQVPILLVRNATAAEIEPPGYRLPLGAQPDGAYRDAEVELRPGDAVVLSSDGLVEAPAQAQAATAGHVAAMERSGELFGFGRLAASAAYWASAGKSAEAVAEGIWQDVTAWAGEESHHDDMTLLVLCVPTP